jgi:hypothetical protein
LILTVPCVEFDARVTFNLNFGGFDVFVFPSLITDGIPSSWLLFRLGVVSSEFKEREARAAAPRPLSFSLGGDGENVGFSLELPFAPGTEGRDLKVLPVFAVESSRWAVLSFLGDAGDGSGSGMGGRSRTAAALVSGRRGEKLKGSLF